MKWQQQQQQQKHTRTPLVLIDVDGMFSAVLSFHITEQSDMV